MTENDKTRCVCISWLFVAPCLVTYDNSIIMVMLDNSADKLKGDGMERKRGTTKYWVQIKGNLYARLQYKDAGGKYRTKYRSIPDKRQARSAVEAMRRELDVH